MKERPAQRRARQSGRTRGNMTQIAGDAYFQAPPAGEPEVEWPVWVGTVPKLAAAFQPRPVAREAVTQARAEGGSVVLSQVLAGDGGVGKSQLAAALTRELRDQERSEGSGLDLLVWAKATESDQIITAYADAAEQLGLTGGASSDLATAAEAFLAWLPTTERRWLIVLDDITDPEAADAWWPDGNHRNGWVLATTRRTDALLSGQSRKLIRLDLYTPEEARAYLRRRLTDAGHPHLYDPDEAGQLAEELGHLPLALGHAAAYMINKRCSTGGYLQRFRDTGNKLNDLLPPNADTEGYGRPVTTALLISLSAVQAADTTGLARPLLELIALMDPLGHPMRPVDHTPGEGTPAYFTSRPPSLAAHTPTGRHRAGDPHRAGLPAHLRAHRTGHRPGTDPRPRPDCPGHTRDDPAPRTACDCPCRSRRDPQCLARPRSQRPRSVRGPAREHHPA